MRHILNYTRCCLWVSAVKVCSYRVRDRPNTIRLPSGNLNHLLLLSSVWSLLMHFPWTDSFAHIFVQQLQWGTDVDRGDTFFIMQWQILDQKLNLCYSKRLGSSIWDLKKNKSTFEKCIIPWNEVEWRETLLTWHFI